MFKKVLIANRGEIACRIMRTLHRLNIASVGVYSEADRDALHVRMANEVICIGPALASRSYLSIENVIAAALKTGAQAIHPGYGFLSENAEFVEAIEKAGLIFIGPSASAIRAMGLKDAAKVLMEKSGVPVVPGYHGENQTSEYLAAEAEKIGYPVLIKARAGGGGKGMRLVEKADEFADALAGAVREGEASFNDGQVLIEKYISTPRHIEVQIFGDNHGNVVHLFERDCSLQRRHQKVIEEAPAPGMTSAMRKAMGDAAVSAARAVNYSGAGTVEFIVDSSEGLKTNRFWFMEMNTRLQVEHPVSEAITGLDFAELQFRVANGEKLPFSQQELTINGWAFEARIYAEDPAREFLPSVGTLNLYNMPEEIARVDSGVERGDVISPHYDPMIGKITVHEATREAALAKLSLALSETYIGGVTTNVAFLHALTQHKGFKSGEVDTGLIGRELETLVASQDIRETDVAIAAFIISQDKNAVGVGASGLDVRNWRQWGTGTYYVDLISHAQEFSCSVKQTAADCYLVSIDLSEVELTCASAISSDCEILDIISGGMRYSVAYYQTNQEIIVASGGRSHKFEIVDALDRGALEEANSDRIISPMPGLVKTVQVKSAEAVKKGQVLVVLEAMKMEHSLVAPRDGIIERVDVKQGDQVDDGGLLVTLVAAASER